MEKQISDVKELDENEIASMIYEKVDAFWGKFPNLWYYVTKDDIVSLSVLDLYKPRKADNVPHIVHYYNTKGERSLKPLIGLVTYNVMVHEARFIHSTGIYNNEARRNVYSPISLSVQVEDSEVTLEDIIKSNDNIPKEIDYIMLVDSLPNKLSNNVYSTAYKKYIVLDYKTLLNKI